MRKSLEEHDPDDNEPEDDSEGERFRCLDLLTSSSGHHPPMNCSFLVDRPKLMQDGNPDLGIGSDLVADGDTLEGWRLCEGSVTPEESRK